MARLFYSLFFLSFINVALYGESVQELFDKGEYSEACVKVDKLFSDNPLDFDINIYYGICANYRGDTDSAMAAFDRAEILNEDDTRVHKHLGDLYAKIGNIEIANNEYDKADRFAEIPVTRENVSGYEANRFSFLLRVSAGGDTNARYDAELSDMNEWLSTPINSNNEPQAVLFAKEYLRVNHVYAPNPYSNFYLKTQLHVYNKTYETFHSEDLFISQAFSGLGWASTNFDFWLPVSYTFTGVGYKDFSEQYSVEPQIRKRFDNRVLLTMAAKYEIQSYNQWERGDKVSYAGDLSLSRWFERNYFRLAYAHLVAEKQDKESPRIFIDRDYNEVDFTYVRAVGSSMEVGIEYLYRSTIYKDIANYTFGEIREDELHQYSGYISYDLTKSGGVMLKYENYDNKSNYIPSDYTKEVISAGFYIYI